MSTLSPKVKFQGAVSLALFLTKQFLPCFPSAQFFLRLISTQIMLGVHWVTSTFFMEAHAFRQVLCARSVLFCQVLYARLVPRPLSHFMVMHSQLLIIMG